MGFRVRPIDALTTRITNLYDERAKLEKQRSGLNQRGMNADNPTPLYDQINARIKAKDSEIFRLRNERGDHIIPGAPKKKTSGSGLLSDPGIREALQPAKSSGSILDDPGIREALGR